MKRASEHNLSPCKSLQGLFLVGLACLMIGGLTNAAIRDATPGPKSPANCAAAKDEESAALQQRVRDAIPAFVSGTVLLATGDEIVVHECYGAAHSGSGREITADTVFDIGSIAKVYTAAAVLALAEEGKLSLDAPIAGYVDGLREESRSVTLYQSLTHTAGWPVYLKGGDFSRKSEARFVREVRRMTVAGSLEERRKYSNVGYALAAYVVEQATGLSFEAYLGEKILKPLQLKRTGFYSREAWSGTGAAYGEVGGKIKGGPAQWDFPGWSLRGQGGMAATATDMFRFVRAIVDGKLLAQAGSEAMLSVEEPAPWRFFASDEVLRPFSTAGFLGWYDAEGNRYLAKGGANDFGFFSLFVYREADNKMLIGLFNGGVIAGVSKETEIGEDSIGHSTLYRRLIDLM